MSKRGKGPKANSPAPTEADFTISVVVDSATGEATAEMKTGVTTPPEAQRPNVPELVTGLARAVRIKWGVPEWLTILASWTGSQFGKTPPHMSNDCAIRATGTMNKNAEGWAWFGNRPLGYDQFGAVCRRLNLDYSNPEACITALSEQCPRIIQTPYTLFKENK